MKKVTRIIGAICMMGLLTSVTTSCNKNEENGEMTINIVAPDFEEEGGERAYINEDKAFMWHEKDYIRVYNLADEANADESATSVFTKIGTASGPTARFRGPSVGAKKAEGYRYFYPVEMVKGDANEINLNLWNANRQTFVLSDHQQYHYYENPTHHLSMVDPAAMAMATKPESLTGTATMQQMLGVASFNVKARTGTTVVVDSVLLHDNQWNLTGEVSLKLHKVEVETGKPHSLTDLYNSFNGLTPEFLYALGQEVEYLGWMPVPGTEGQDIMMNCMYTHEDGEFKGVTVQTGGNYTNFNFLLRPLALSQGFELTLYLQDGTSIELTHENFQYNETDLNPTWATKAKKIKKYFNDLSIN